VGQGQVRLLLELVRSYELDQLIELASNSNQRCEWIFHPACADAAAMVDVRSLTLRASSWPTRGQVGVFLETSNLWLTLTLHAIAGFLI